MTQIEAIIHFSENGFKSYFERNPPNYSDKQDVNLIARKRCQVYIRKAMAIQSGAGTEWTPTYKAVAQLLEDFAPGVYVLERREAFSLK